MLPLTVCALRLLPRFTPEIAAVAQVVPPMAEIVVTKLFALHADAPPYFPTCPALPVKRSALTAFVIAKEVVVAFVVVPFTPVKFCSVVEPATNRSPTPLMVVVAVIPTYNLPSDCCVLDALPKKLCSTVHTFECARFISPVNVAPSAAAEPNVKVEFGDVAPMVEFESIALDTERQPPSAPTTEIVVGSWFVHGFDEPVYFPRMPVEPNRPSALVTVDTVRFVVDARAKSAMVVDDVLNCAVDDAESEIPVAPK